jgi:signal transduction histidine kinase
MRWTLQIGGGKLKIRISNSREYSNMARFGIRLTVADNGSGIKPEVRRTLFEPFVSTKADTGTGLGLWISSEIVNRHSGKIQVKSSTLSQSSWTVFSVFLPLNPTGGNRTLPEISTILDGTRKEAQSESPFAMALPMQQELVS